MVRASSCICIATNTAYTIYTLALNEVAHIGDAYWRRVPGGWIVTETYADPDLYGHAQNDANAVRLHPVFVPYSDEYKYDATGRHPWKITQPPAAHANEQPDDDTAF